MSSKAFQNADKLNGIVSVLQFGARGDGTTDDTAAIQAAIDYAGTVSGSVYFPTGTYIVSNSFTVPSNVLIYGDGSQSVIRCAATTLAPTYNPTNIAAGFRVFLLYNVSNVRITGLKIDSSLVYQAGDWKARDIYAWNATNVSIDNCSFLSSGGAVVFTNSSRYLVQNNDIVCQSSNNIPHHDGVIDQWWGSHDFVISGNRINGQTTVGRYAILLTATNSDGSAGTPMYNAVISDNIVENCKYGIWVMGRSGRCSRVSVANNIVRNITVESVPNNAGGEGIAVTNSDGISVVGNNTSNTYKSGITIFSETGFLSGCTGCVISGNTVNDAGNGNPSPSISGERSAISVRDTALNAGVSINGNCVLGNTHSYAIYMPEYGAELIGGSYQPGVVPYFQNRGIGSTIRVGGNNTPDAIYWVRGSESEKMAAIQNAINSTSNAVTLKFQNGATDLIGANDANQFRVANIVSSVNGVQVYPNTAGNSPIITAIGSDANLDLKLAGKGTGAVVPNGDNTINLGSASLRWKTVYAGTGTINTSDARDKQQARELADAERATAVAVKGLLRAFKFNDAVEIKGDSARWHFGVIAQDVRAAFETNGLNAEEYGLFCYDEWDAEEEQRDGEGNVISPARPAGNRYGIRYDELLAFIITAI